MPSTIQIYDYKGKPTTKPGRAIGKLLGQELDDWTLDNRTPHEVMIPPGKCVLWWAGCPRVSWKRNYCRVHWREFHELGDLAPYHLVPKVPQPQCTKCKKRMKSSKHPELCTLCLNAARTRRYRARHPDQAHKWYKTQYDNRKARNLAKGLNASGTKRSSQDTALAA